MSQAAVASVRAEVEAARDATTSDLERYLMLQRLVDALARVDAAWRRLESVVSGRGGTEIAESAVELQAVLAAAAGHLEPTLQQHVAAIALRFEAAVLAVTSGTRGARKAVAGPILPSPATRAGTRAAAVPSTPVPVVSPACFGASAPSSAAPSTRFVTQFAVYPEGGAAAARALLAEAQRDARVVTDVGGDALTLGTVVEVAVSGAGMTIEGQPRHVERLLWKGRTTMLGLEVELAPDAASTVLRYDIIVDGIVLAKIRLPVDVNPRPKAAPPRSAEARFVRSAFASYSSKDRERVIDRVAAIRIAAKVDVFLDCHDLNPGEAWQPNLARAIDGCDTFLLFWSDAAAESPWVQWEWKRALTRLGLEGMQFHPLENGVKPPHELAAIHLGDPYMDLHAAERVRRTTAVAVKEAA